MAEVGNQLWKLRKRDGKPKLYETPRALLEKSLEYLDWVEDNPLYEHKAMNVGGEVHVVKIPKMRATTLGGLCIFLGMSPETWRLYRTRPDYLGIITEIEAIIYENKFTGAAADLLNANIIARDLGLADKQVVQATTVRVTADMSPQDAAKAYQDLMNARI